jgi:hypothetical protein
VVAALAYAAAFDLDSAAEWVAMARCGHPR